MTRECLVVFLGCAVVLVLRSVVVAEQCPQDISNENCSLTTHNNEIEALSEPHIQETTTHTSELTTTLTSSNTLTENSDENTLRPLIFTNSLSLPTSNSTEISISNSIENSTSNSSDISTSGSVEFTTLTPTESASNEMETSTVDLPATTMLYSSEASTSNIPEMSSSNSTETSTSKSSETTPSNFSETSTLKSESSTSLSLENTTSNLPEISTLNSSEISTSKPSESSTSNSSENPTINLTDILVSNSSEVPISSSSETVTLSSVETSTSNLLLDTSTSDSMVTSTSNSSENSTSDFTERSSVSNSSETSTPTSMENPMANISEASTSNLIETSTTHHLLDASTSNFISTETTIDNLVSSVSDRLKETSTDTTTVESLPEKPTDTPTEQAMNDETTTVLTTIMMDEPKGRALNFSAEEGSPSNVLSNTSNHDDDEEDDDSDVTDLRAHDDDSYNIDVDSLDPKILAPKNQIHNSSLSVCEKGGLTYENGDKLEVGCESVCTCKDGKMDCTDRCVGPYFRRGKKIDDPLCSAKEADDACCSILVCAGDTETEPLEICSYENKTYSRGDSFEKDCTEKCTCEAAGKITCKPRCPPIMKTSDRCVEVPDPNDFCCFKVLCDVTLDEHDTEKEEEKAKTKLSSARYINSSAILLTFDPHLKSDDTDLIIEVSNDKNNWDYYRPLPGGIVFVKDRIKYLKIENTNDIVEVEDSALGPSTDKEHHSQSESDLALQLDIGHGLQENGHRSESSTEQIDTSMNCHYKGMTYKDGEEHNDDCVSLCVCQKGEMKCLKIECPTYFGLDVIDPTCIKWETVPPDFAPSPPNCCPEKVHCADNGSCEYEGRTYRNWEPIPSNVTGCEQKCYCEMGNVECQNVCLPVTALPPSDLGCPPNLATVSHIPTDDCCMYWVCKETRTQETQHNQTESDIKGQTTNDPTDNNLGPLSPKGSSKVMGPLAVYANDDTDRTVANNSLAMPYKPTISPNENPFYHKKQPHQNPHKPSSPKDKLIDHLHTPYSGPFNLNVGKINSKLSKDVRNKMVNRGQSLFITPPPHTFVESDYKKHENFVPNYYNPPPTHVSFNDEPGHINIHSHGSPEEVLQFIHQHPEISNYPSGSVLEIHSVPPDNNVKQAFGEEGLQSVNRPKIHLVPYIVPQNAEGQALNDHLPPGLSLDELLEEFQKNSQALQNNPQTILPPPQNSANYGPMLKPLQNGHLIHNKLNVTNPGNDGQTSPGLFPEQHPQEEIVIHSLEAVDPHKVRLSFTVPSIYVGLHGRFEVRYTHNKDEKDLDAWMLTVFAPPNDLIATPSLEFDLTDLKGDTEYSIKITVTLRDHHNMPSSKIYKIKTPKEVDPPVIPINPDLAITDINATWVTVVWRAFTQYELQFIDGIQLRYKEIDGRIYTATPLIHRAVTRHTLEKLKPNTKYEIGIYFIPFPGQMTELRTENILHFTTANEIDTYGFNVTLDISQIKSQSVEISWSGVPYPEDKYVNIYRAIYQSDTGKEDHSTFKIAKRDSPTKTIIKDLKPGIRYRLWLEVYLTNGKTKTSNVEDFTTKPRAAPALGSSTQQDKLSRAEVLETKGDYYGPLVIVAILAAIAILSTLILLLILVRRHNQNKASITPPSTRISQSAYDNPTYKVEIQQETMGL